MAYEEAESNLVKLSGNRQFIPHPLNPLLSPAEEPPGRRDNETI